MDQNKKPANKPPEPDKRNDALERQLEDTKRRDHDKHLSKYRQPNPNVPKGDPHGQ